MPLTEAKTDPEERKALQKWLTADDPCELFGTTGEPNQEILSIIPEENHLKLGQKKEAYAAYTPLDVPAWEHMGVEKGTQASCMKVVGEYLHDVIKQYVNYSSSSIRQDSCIIEMIGTPQLSVSSLPMNSSQISLMLSFATAVVIFSGTLPLALKAVASLRFFQSTPARACSRDTLSPDVPVYSRVTRLFLVSYTL